MVAINIVTAIVVTLLTAEVVYLLVSYFTKDREGKINFIRSFKKGKCFAVLIVAIPLYFVGFWFEGQSFLTAFFNGISHCVELIVLKFGIAKVDKLMSANAFYSVAVYYCCTLVTLNAILFGASVAGQYFWQLGQKIKNKFSKKDRLYILGSNKKSLSIFKSNKNLCAFIVDNISKQDKLDYYIAKVGYLSTTGAKGEVDKIIKIVQTKDKKVNVIVNKMNDEENLLILKEFLKVLDEADKVTRDIYFENLKVVVFGEPKYETIYDDIVAKAYGCIQYRNKYQMIAMNFIEKHPLSEFLDDRHIDYKTALVKDNVNINVCMVGYGKTNQQIFLASVANNQFITKVDGKIAIKKVNYHIFDKKRAEHNKNLNHTYNRFENLRGSLNQDEYLPFPDKPAEVFVNFNDINEAEFYSKMKAIVSTDKNKNEIKANFVIIAFQTDLENIDMAQKLVEKRREWDADELVIFVKVRNPKINLSLFEEKNVIVIGNEDECVYNIDEILNADISEMAQSRDEFYELEKNILKNRKNNKDFKITSEFVKEVKDKSHFEWYTKKNRFDRDSSMFCCLSLQSKLNMMDLMYCKKDEYLDCVALDEKDFYEIYAKDDMPQKVSVSSDGFKCKDVVVYPLDFKDSLRKNFAIHEHYRWNSFMISRGMVLSSKKEILEDRKADGSFSNGKIPSLRKHGNITTMDGLVEFRKMLAERDGEDEKNYDVIQYDYQLLDDAVWLLDSNGYKIVRRDDVKKSIAKANAKN